MTTQIDGGVILDLGQNKLLREFIVTMNVENGDDDELDNMSPAFVTGKG